MITGTLSLKNLFAVGQLGLGLELECNYTIKGVHRVRAGDMIRVRIKVRMMIFSLSDFSNYQQQQGQR